MPIYTIKTPSGHELEIEAADETAAMTGAERWHQAATTYKSPNGKSSPSGVKLNIEGKNVTVSEDFLKLTPEQQNDTVDEIATSIGLRKPDTSYTGALAKGASDVVSGVGKSIKEFVSPEKGSALQATGKSIADPKYRSATEDFSNPTDGASKHFLGRAWKELPRVVAEQAPGYAADIAATMLAKRFGPLGQAAAGFGSHLLRTAGNEAQQRATGRTGDENATPTTEDKVIGGSSAVIQAALNSVGLGKIVSPSRVAGVGLTGVKQTAKNVGAAAAAEGATEAAQEAISQTASTAGTDKGLRYDADAILDAGIFGAAGGGAFSSPRAIKDATTAIRFRDINEGLSPQAAGVANRLLSKVDGDASKLQSPATAYRAVADTQADILNELRSAAAFMNKHGELGDVEVNNAVNRALKGNDLTEADIKAIDRTEADDLKALAKQAVAVARLTKKGSFDSSDERFSGGLAERARRFVKNSPITAGGAYAGTNAIANGALEGLTSSIVSNAAPALGAYASVRAAERALGITAPARSFVEKFAEPNAPIRALNAEEPSTLPSAGSVPSTHYRAQPARPWGEPEPVISNAADVDSNTVIDDGIASVIQELRIKKLVERLAGLDASEASDAPSIAPEVTPFQSAVSVAKVLNRQRENERQASYAGLSDADVRELAAQQAVDAGVIEDDPASRARYSQGVQRKRDMIREAAFKAANTEGYSETDVEKFQPFFRRLMIARTRKEASDIISDAAKVMSFNGGHALTMEFGKDTIEAIWRK